LERREGGAKLVSDIDLVQHKKKQNLLLRFLENPRPRPKGNTTSSKAALPQSKN
jgi:putative ATP-binding cassette transporter